MKASSLAVLAPSRMNREAIHLAVSRVVRNVNQGLPDFERAYSDLAQASNFRKGLVGGRRIIHLFHLSLVRTEGKIRTAIERLLPENERAGS